MIGSVGSSRSSASRSSDSSPTSATKESSPATKETSLADQEAAAQDAAGTQKAQELQRNYMTDGIDDAAPSDSSRLSGISRATPASAEPGSTQDVLTQAAKQAGVDPGWAQSPALDSLLNAESSSSIHGPLNTDAENPSGAYGIGQLMPETQAQHLPEGADPSDPVSQATAMMSYIRDRYGSPEAAWSFHQGNGWY